MTEPVVREDLSKRTALSKSVLTEFDICPQKSWFGIHDPRPFVPIEKVTFGSALDAAIEVIVQYAAMGQEPDMTRAIAAAQWIADRDDVGVEVDEVAHAAARFVIDVLPRHGWSLAVTQRSVSAVIEALGECNGHPDICLPGEVWDVKATTGKKEKDPRSVELGFYVLLREAAGDDPISRVGYLEWRRGEPRGSLKTGKWVEPSFDVTDEFRRWTLAKAVQYVRAKRADRVLNPAGRPALNFTMTGGPAFAGACNGCVYNPASGGPCELAYQEEEAA